MRLYRWLSDYHGSERGIALAIGNFDGFHMGHQAVIERMKQKAKEHNLETAVMIFEPQPMEFFGKEVPARLFSVRDKLRMFRAVGIENVFCMNFTYKFADMDDKQFTSMLFDKIGVKSVTVGSDFNFGRRGAYNLDDLKRCAQEAGVECSAIDKVENDGKRISSTLLRSLVKDGDFSTVTKYMGHEYSIAGRVVHGNAIGRTIGFPTANINLNRRVCPLKGVYAVKITLDGAVYDGVANVGYRPTISTPTLNTLLEVHIINFTGDIYGKEIEVTFKYKIRDEMKFESLDALVQQISADKERALTLLSRKDT